MKRTKTGSQPTRIMPRRGRKRQNIVSSTDADENSRTHLPLEDNRHQKTGERVIPENSSRSESQLDAEPSASGAQGGTSSRRKRTKLHTENSTGSKFSKLNELSASTGSHGNRKSPELNCSICLSAVENRAFTDACYHTFCFECLVEWSHVRAVCPLCKKSFRSIIHSFRSYDDYKLYQVPKSYVSNSANSASSLNNSAPSHFARVARFLNRSNAETVSPLNDGDHMLALRRRVYSHSEEMQLRGFWSSDGVVISPPHQVSPAMFDCYPGVQEHVRPWVLRDIAVIIGSGDVAGIADIVLGLLRNFPITSEDFYERLFPYLGLHTRRFLQELDAFARSPFDVTTYDARVVYSTGPHLEAFFPLPTEHVEDISSSDDSDIEIVSPAVVSSSEPARNSSVGLTTDRVFPDLLCYLRMFQRNLLMSLSFMNHQSRNSGWESPVPGPSGLGQALVTDDSDDVGSRASQSVDDGEERSNSPMVVSDADSDIVVVDVDRPGRSPIHISSEEDDSAAQQIKTRRRVKRRRWRVRRHREHGSEFEQSDSLTVTAVKNEVPQADETSAHSELHATGPKSAGCFVERNAEELMHAVEQSNSSRHMEDQSSSHGSSIKPNDRRSPSSVVSPSKPYSQPEIGKPANTAKHQHMHPKRSRSANSVANMSIVSVVSSADDVNPLPCKKHVRGHKSSKQKAREVVTETSSVDVVCDNAEKLVTGDQVETTAGSQDLPDNCNIEQSSADVLNEVAVPSVGESSIACVGFSSSPLPVSCSLDKVTGEEKLDTVSQSDCLIPVPCTSEVCLLPAALLSGPGLEDSDCLSSSTAKVTFDIADECLPIKEENSVQYSDCACSSSCDVVQVHSLNAEAASVANDDGNVDNRNPEARTDLVLSSDCVQSGNVDASHDATDPLHSCDVWSDCAEVIMTKCQSPSPDLPSLSNPRLTYEHNDCSSEISRSISISAASSTSSSSHLSILSVSTCKWENEDADESDNQPLQNDSSYSLPVKLQESEGILFASSSSHEDTPFNEVANCFCTDTAISDNRSSLPTDDIRSTESEKCGLIDYSSTEQFRLASSPRLVIDENQASSADLGLVGNDSIIAVPSPVGIESSDSEVEWLESGMFGRQRCISISSGGSSVVCSTSDTDDIESVLSDSDSLEIFEDEPPASQLEEQTDQSRRLCQTHPASPKNSAFLPSSSDIASTVDMNETEPAVVSERVAVEPQMSQLQDQTAESKNSYQSHPSSPHTDALLPSSSVDMNETESAVISEQVTIEPQVSYSEDQTAESKHSHQSRPSSLHNGASLPSLSDVTSSVDKNETAPAVISEAVAVEPQTPELEDQTAESRHLYLTQPSLPQDSTLLPSSSDVVSSMDISETEPAIISEQIALEETLQPRGNDAF